MPEISQSVVNAIANDFFSKQPLVITKLVHGRDAGITHQQLVENLKQALIKNGTIDTIVLDGLAIEQLKLCTELFKGVPSITTIGVRNLGQYKLLAVKEALLLAFVFSDQCKIDKLLLIRPDTETLSGLGSLLIKRKKPEGRPVFFEQLKIAGSPSLNGGHLLKTTLTQAECSVTNIEYAEVELRAVSWLAELIVNLSEQVKFTFVDKQIPQELADQFFTFLKIELQKKGSKLACQLVFKDSNAQSALEALNLHKRKRSDEYSVTYFEDCLLLAPKNKEANNTVTQDVEKRLDSSLIY